jgi:hypothetical protein
MKVLVDTNVVENGVTHIITRNKADYEKTDNPCVSPTEFIAYTRETI